MSVSPRPTRWAGQIRRRDVLALLAALPWAAGPAAWSETPQLPAPGPKDTCPVCGMFVSLYPDWVATVLDQDGHAHHFDGAKDLFKYLLNRAKYAPGHRQAAIAAIGVTAYYSVARIDAHAAWYVIGSDVLGPMGHELVPLATEAEAVDFQRDHKGKRILRFDDVTPAVLDKLDYGLLE